MASISPIAAKIFVEAGMPVSELSPAANSITHMPTGNQYFTKTQQDVKQMRGEIAGLRAMSVTSKDLVPKLLGFEVDPTGKQATMVSQYFDLSSAKEEPIQRDLGRKLANMHSIPPTGTEGYSGDYGFAVPTHCGATEQDNTWETNWEVFFRDRRLGYLIRKIDDKQLTDLWGELRAKAVPLLLGSFHPPPKPVILHGDLWSGNAGYDKLTCQAVIFDPASYYGHNEADLGFSQEFYDEYHQIHPRSEPYYQERQKLYELYHHLNVSCLIHPLLQVDVAQRMLQKSMSCGTIYSGTAHYYVQHTHLFGGSYQSGTVHLMRGLIDWAERQ
nr:fructosamine kinase [Cryptococcus depauperatus CBS 7855]